MSDMDITTAPLKYRAHKLLADYFHVEGHPQHPGFTFATVRKMGNRDWRIESVFVNGGVAPGGKFASREKAALAALQADLDARSYAKNERERDRNVPLAIVNKLLLSSSVTWLDDIEQVDENTFRVTATSERRGDKFTMLVNRAGDRVDG